MSIGSGMDGIEHSFLNVDGNRVYLGNFDENGLNCNWDWDDNRNDNIGAFPVMVD